MPVVGDHLDALGSGLLKDRGEGLGGVGDDGDGRGLLRDEILDDLDLLLGGDVRSSLRSRVVAVGGTPLLDSDVHSIKPGDSLDLDDGDHRLAGIA